MREIKFRQWTGRKFHLWGVHVGGKYCFNSPMSLTEYCINEQFTGLLDKNGVEIYEGDYVHIPTEGISEVKYDPPFFIIGNILRGASSFNSAEVVGNTHMNPELAEL